MFNATPIKIPVTFFTDRKTLSFKCVFFTVLSFPQILMGWFSFIGQLSVLVMGLWNFTFVNV
jgi:hypothetical protein